MEFNTCKLCNGGYIIAVKNAHLHKINIGFYFKAGVIYENKQINGITHLLEHLFFRKLGNMKQKELYYNINKMGAVFKGTTYADFIRLDISVSPEYFKQAYNILIAVLNDFSWTEEEIFGEKQVVLKQIEFSSTSFEKYADNLYFSHTNKALPIMGTEKSIGNISDEIIAEWKNKIFQVSNLCCVLTGAFTDMDFMYAKHLLESVPPKAFKMPRKHTIIPKNFCSRDESDDNILESEWDISDILVSFDVNRQYINEYEADLLSSILGEGDGSALSMALRENTAFTDEVFSYVDVYKNLSKISILFSVNNTQLLEAIDLLFQTICGLKGLLTEYDLCSSKMFYTKNQQYHYDDSRYLNFYIAWRYFILNLEIDLDKISQNYAEITVDDINKASKRLWLGENLAITVTNNNDICPLKKLKETISKNRKLLTDS